MKIEEPRAMRELHELRAQHYEETKNMTREEYVKWINEKARKVMKEYGIESKYTDKN